MKIRFNMKTELLPQLPLNPQRFRLQAEVCCGVLSALISRESLHWILKGKRAAFVPSLKSYGHD